MEHCDTCLLANKRREVNGTGKQEGNITTASKQNSSHWRDLRRSKWQPGYPTKWPRGSLPLDWSSGLKCHHLEETQPAPHTQKRSSSQWHIIPMTWFEHPNDIITPLPQKRLTSSPDQNPKPCNSVPLNSVLHTLSEYVVQHYVLNLTTQFELFCLRKAP